MEHLNVSNIKKHSPYRVFVIEDDFEISMIIERVLRSLNVTISLDWATSAETATSQLKYALSGSSKSPYDLIVADVFLDGESTGIDFWQTCQQLLPETPVLLTSSLSLDRFFAAIGQSCISPPFLQKPFSPRECRQVFETMLKYSRKEARHNFI